MQRFEAATTLPPHVEDLAADLDGRPAAVTAIAVTQAEGDSRLAQSEPLQRAYRIAWEDEWVSEYAYRTTGRRP